MKRVFQKSVVLFIFSYVMLSANMGGYSIYITDEARNAQCAYEMFERGDLIVPTYNQVLRTDKPPLHYYFMMAGYAVFGKTPFAARFFSAIFGALLIVLTFLFTRKYASEKVSNWTIVVLLSSLGFITQFHLAVPDPYLIFFISAAHMAYFHFDQTKKSKFLYLAYVAVGFGVLAKGPIAVVLPGISIFFYLISQKKLSWPSILKLKPLAGILIVLLIAAPWYIAVHLKTDGAWTEGFFIGHNIERFSDPKEGHGGTFLLPPIFLLLTLLPFSVFLPQAIYRSVKMKDDPFITYSLIISLVVVVFFSIASTKLPSYVSPAFPFAAFLIATFMSDIDSLKKRNFLIPSFIFTLLALLIWYAVFEFVPKEKGMKQLTDIHWYFLPTAILGIGVSVAALVNKRTLTLIMISFSFVVTHQLFFYFAFPKVDAQNPVRKTLSVVKNAEHLINYKRMNQAYPFILNREIKSYDDLEEIKRILERQPETVVISRKKYLKDLGILQLKEVAREVDILDNTTTVILKKADQP